MIIIIQQVIFFTLDYNFLMILLGNIKNTIILLSIVTVVTIVVVTNSNSTVNVVYCLYYYYHSLIVRLTIKIIVIMFAT